LRANDPKQFTMFIGRDQMQALTGMFARQFGTPNYAAHDGFCPVNMAASMILNRDTERVHTPWVNAAGAG
jgi:hypothetical protein